MNHGGTETLRKPDKRFLVREMLRKLPFVPAISVISAALCFHLFLTGPAISAEKNEVQIRKQPEIQQVKPRKPVRIKLHRTAKGEYTWDLTGDSVDEIVKADKRLRTLLKIEQTP